MPNIWRLGQVRDAKFGTNVSNEKLLNATKCHSYSFYYFQVIKGNPTVGKTTPAHLQKAFDTINHDILLKKLSIIGFSDHTVKWFQSYLSNHKFMVNLGNSFSEVSNILCGVPQG